MVVLILLSLFAYMVLIILISLYSDKRRSWPKRMNQRGLGEWGLGSINKFGNGFLISGETVL